MKSGLRFGPYSLSVGSALREAVLPMLGLSLAPFVDDWLTAGRASVFHHQLLVFLLGSVEQTT